MHTLEVRSFDFMDIDQLPLAPESDLMELVVEGVNAEIHLLIGIRVEFEL